METNHVFLTRFNLPSLGAESIVRAQESWLQNRWVLFERYCMPSVAAQTSDAGNWIIYFDPESPQWLLDKIEQLNPSGLFTPIFREEVSAEDLTNDIASVVAARGARLATTNLDNDDAVAADFVARLCATSSETPRAAVYFGNGLIKSDGSLYLRRDEDNAFCSVIESWDKPVTCWADWHNRLGLHMPVRVLDGAPAWLQVVHGQNVSNRVQGKRCSPVSFRDTFGSFLDDVPVPSTRELLTDQFVSKPYRALREFLRAGIKGLALRILGKDGWTRAKHLKAKLLGR